MHTTETKNVEQKINEMGDKFFKEFKDMFHDLFATADNMSDCYEGIKEKLVALWTKKSFKTFKEKIQK